MIDARFSFAPAADLVAIDLWEGPLPGVPGVRIVQVEPHRWWMIDGGTHAEQLAAEIDGNGACTAIGGGFVRATVSGPGWRDLLSVSGFLDCSAGALPPGSVGRSVIHHVAVTILVTDEGGCEVYCASTYARTLEELWRGACGGN